MKREPGFYWVKYRGEWLVSEWDGYFWTLPGQLNYDTDFEAIHETRLIPPEEEKDEPIPVHATPEGRLYIKPADLFAKKSVQELILKIAAKREQKQNLIDLMKTDEENGMYD